MIPHNGVVMAKGTQLKARCSNNHSRIGPIGRHMANLVIRGLRKGEKGSQVAAATHQPDAVVPRLGGDTGGARGGGVVVGDEYEGDDNVANYTDNNHNDDVSVPPMESSSLSLWMESKRTQEEEEYNNMLECADIQIGPLDAEWEEERLDSYLLPARLRPTRLRIHDTVEGRHVNRD